MPPGSTDAATPGPGPTSQHRLRRRLTLLTALAVAATPLLGILPAQAATGALTNTSWAVSNSATGATGVTYTFQFTTATSATLGSVTATVPAGTAVGTLALGSVYGIGAGSASYSSSAHTLTYTVTTPATVAAGIPIYIEFTGMTNTTTAGSYTSTVSTYDNSATPVLIDSGTSQSVTFGSSNTAVTVQIAKSLTFTNDTPSFTLLMDPSLTSLADETRTVKLGITTNAGSGYTLAAADTGLKTSGGTHAIPPVTSGVATGVTTFPANAFGVSATLTYGGSSTAALQGALATAGSYVGYTTAGQSLLVASKPTGNAGDQLALTNQVKIDYTTPAGTYTDTITYTATPTY